MKLLPCRITDTIASTGSCKHGCLGVRSIWPNVDHQQLVCNQYCWRLQRESALSHAFTSPLSSPTTNSSIIQYYLDDFAEDNVVFQGIYFKTC